MSEDVVKASKILNKLILESEEYQKYCLYKKEIKQTPELKKRLDEFRMKNFELQLEGNPDDHEAVVNLAREYRDVLENPIAACYLNSELSFCKMLQTVSKDMCSGVDLELDFL